MLFQKPNEVCRLLMDVSKKESNRLCGSCFSCLIIIISLSWNEMKNANRKIRRRKKLQNNVHPTNWPTKKSYIATLLFVRLIIFITHHPVLSLESFGACASASGSKYLNIHAYAFSSYRKRKCLLFPLDQLIRPFASFCFETKLSPVQIKPILVSTVVNSIWYLCQLRILIELIELFNR